MKFLTLISILIPLITLVQCIKQSCPQQDFLQEIEDLHNREKRSVISANIQKTIDLYLTPEAGGVALIISTSIMIFQTVGYIFFGKILRYVADFCFMEKCHSPNVFQLCQKSS